MPSVNIIINIILTNFIVYLIHPIVFMIVVNMCACNCPLYSYDGGVGRILFHYICMYVCLTFVVFINSRRTKYAYTKYARYSVPVTLLLKVNIFYTGVYICIWICSVYMYILIYYSIYLYKLKENYNTNTIFLFQ